MTYLVNVFNDQARQVKAEPLARINGKEKRVLRFDCKPCEMHVVGKIKRAVLNEGKAQPMSFYKTHKTRPDAQAAH